MVDQVKQAYDVDVEWLPFLLRPDMPEEGQELPAAIKAKAGQSNNRIRQMAESMGLTYKPSQWMPNPRLAHEATEHASGQGKGEEFHRIVFQKYYGEGQNIGSWDVLRVAAIEAGLDATVMEQEVKAGRYRQSVEEKIEQAYAIGVNSVPTYVLNDRYGIVGAQPFGVFQKVIERILAQNNSADHLTTSESEDSE